MYFLVETGFHHVGQPSLALLNSGIPHASASQSADITIVSHCVQPFFSCLTLHAGVSQSHVLSPPFYSLFHSFIQILNTYYMPGTFLGDEDIAVSKTYKNAWLSLTELTYCS